MTGPGFLLVPGDAPDAHRSILELVPEADEFAYFLPLYDHWRGLRGDRPAPDRSDLDPVDLPRTLLPNLMLIEVGHDPLDFRFRLSGTGADTIINRNLAGARLLDLPPREFTRSMHDDLARMATDLQPQFVRVSFAIGESIRRSYCALRLPFRDPQGRLDLVLSLVDHGIIRL